MSIQSDIQKLEPGTKIELFVIDLTSLGGGVSRFHAGTNKLKQPVVWQGNTYQPWPVEASGFEYNGRGQSPRPKIRIANTNGLVTALNRDYDDICGAKVVRKRTFARYLDAINFPGGVNAEADPTAEFPDDIYYVERKVGESNDQVEYELAGIWDVEGIMLPARQVIASTCPTAYRSADCGYTGGPVATSDDTATNDPALDDCGKRLSSCKLRFGQYGDLPYGGFPSAGKLNR